MAGPWFTVQQCDDRWQRLEHIWISDGTDDCEGFVEIKIELELDNENG